MDKTSDKISTALKYTEEINKKIKDIEKENHEVLIVYNALKNEYGKKVDILKNEIKDDKDFKGDKLLSDDNNVSVTINARKTTKYLTEDVINNIGKDKFIDTCADVNTTKLKKAFPEVIKLLSPKETITTVVSVKAV